jgi:hypothetical protein
VRQWLREFNFTKREWLAVVFWFLVFDVFLFGGLWLLLLTED